MTKSSLLIWHLLHNVKSMVKILSIYLSFIENMNFTKLKRATILEKTRQFCYLTKKNIIIVYFLKKTMLKFMFSKKATKIDKIFTIDLTLCSKCQIDSEDFVKFCGLLRKHELFNLQVLHYFNRPVILVLTWKKVC